jgi:predicted transcriptional regulator
VKDPEPDFARRLRKAAGADPSASGATRICGSSNWKPRYTPNFPTVEIIGSNPGLTVTRAELEAAGVVAAKMPPRAAPPTAWPDWQKCLEKAPKSKSRPGHQRESMADFTWSLMALRWGHTVEDTTRKLMEISLKARENGEHYATKTVWNAAAEVDNRPAAAVDRSPGSVYPEGVMEVHFTPEQEAQLSQIASHAGTDAEHLVKDAALRLVEEDAKYRAAVREGIAQADRGELIDDEEVRHWLEERERS